MNIELARLENEYKKGRSDLAQYLLKKMPKLEDHLCRFNDAPQRCDCYDEAQGEIRLLLASELKEL